MDGDGVLDLVIHFESGDAGFEADDPEGELVDLTHDGIKLFGTDSVRIVAGGGKGSSSVGGPQSGVARPNAPPTWR